MPIVSRPPRHPALVGLVDRVWRATPEPAAQEVRVEWVLPTCRAQLILSPESSVFVGPKVVAERIERRANQPMVGVSLMAGTASAFTGVGGSEACGATETLDSVWSVGSLPHQLAEESNENALDRIEAELVKRLHTAAATPLVMAAESAIRAGQSVSQAASTLGADRRTLVPQFRRTIGVAPKHYERICRFNRAIEAIRQPQAAPLATIAANQGYADQAHLSREIRHFAQTTPSKLYRDGGAMVNHVEADKIFKT